MKLKPVFGKDLKNKIKPVFGKDLKNKMKPVFGKDLKDGKIVERLKQKIPVLFSNRKILLTTGLIGIMLVAAMIGLITALILHHAENLPLTQPYSNKALVYQASEDTALALTEALSSNLCVGKDNTSTGDIVLKEGESAALFALDDKNIIFAKNMYEKIYPASITKIMTAILTLKYGNMDDIVTIMWRDLELESGSQVVGFRIGDRVSVRELLHGLLIHSGNDAAMALARYVGGGSMNTFIQMMNDELIQIGATGSHFTNPTGLQDTDHYTTVYDIYLMLNEAIKYSDFVSIMQIAVYNVSYTDASGAERFVNLDSTDHYLTGEIKPPKDVVVLGGKTGTTSAAGHCLAIVSQNAFGQPYISIVVGAQTTEDLYEDMNVLLSHIN
ncbi:MAG TPA: D-alanyl-D-alanine carboxypeptidase [Lachnospiraceae bacterium]|nr:D-alanyl-D-alanine carboxypeptidase [Lachnospiraceae bacterium]